MDDVHKHNLSNGKYIMMFFSPLKREKIMKKKLLHNFLWLFLEYDEYIRRIYYNDFHIENNNKMYSDDSSRSM